MKKIFLLITLFVSTSLLMKAQIPNPSFENWDTIDNLCNRWFSLNDAFGFTNTSRENVSVDGNYSIGLASLSVPGFGIVPGLATTGALNTITNTIEGGYATTERPDSLIGYVIENTLVGDTSSILVIVTHHGTTSQEIGRGGIRFTGVNSGFRRFSFPINYTSALSTDSILIIMTAGSLSSTSAGSTLKVDKLSYYPATGTGIEVANKQTIEIYQTTDLIKLENVAENSHIQLVDMNGKIRSENQSSINTSTLSNGMYFIQISHPNFETYTKKLLIQH